MTDEIITSRRNPRVKQAAKLRYRRQRDQQSRCLIDGVRELCCALDAGVAVLEAFVCDELLRAGDGSDLCARLRSAGTQLTRVTSEVFSQLSYGDRAEGIVAVAETPHETLETLQLPECPIVAVLDGVEKPGNLGAILRSADASGVSAVVAAGTGTDLYNPNVIRASLGTVFTLAVCAAPGEAALDWLRGKGLSIFAARPAAEVPYDQAEFSGPAAIVLGSEALGLSDRWNAADIVSIALPMRGTADSLNVSTAAAVLFYEALRQRR